MSFESIIMPILAFVMGIVSIYADPKDTEKKWLKHSLISGLILTCGFSIYFGVQKDIENKQDKDKLEAKITKLTTTSVDIKEDINKLSQKLEERGFTPNKAKSATLNIVEESNKANTELIPELQQNRENKALIKVEYFPKDVDPQIIRETLQKLGFKLETKPAKITESPTNSIWFGKNVKIDDVKLVAYTLIRAGVQIKAIRPFKNLSEKNSLLIQIGSDVQIQNLPALTVEKIRKARKFTRENVDLNP